MTLTKFAIECVKTEAFKIRASGLTFCDEFVILGSMFMGCDELAGVNYANVLIGRLEMSPKFKEVSAKEAQEAANSGALVIAGWASALTGPGGHVAIVVPGKLGFSTTLGRVHAAVLANIGRKNFVGKHAGYGFTEPPRYYLWLE